MTQILQNQINTIRIMQYPDYAKLHKSDSNYAAPKFPIASHPKLSEKFEVWEETLINYGEGY